MPRILSPVAAQAILARETAVVFLSSMRITHADLPETIRIVNNTEPVIRADGEYIPWAFEAPLPDDNEQPASYIDVTIDNVDRRVSRMIRDLGGEPPQAVIEVFTAQAPDVVERGPFAFSVLGSELDVMTIRLSLGYEEDFLNQGVPAQSYTPSNSPGLWP